MSDVKINGAADALMNELFLFCRNTLNDKLLKSKYGRYILECVGIFIAVFLLFETGDILHKTLLIASFGASCVIMFSLPKTKFAAPKNIVGGYFLCSLVGAAVYHLLGNNAWEIALAVSLSVLVMLLTDLLHPPAGSVTILAMTAGTPWSFVLFPVTLGALIVLAIALLYNLFLNKILEEAEAEQFMASAVENPHQHVNVK